MIITEHALMEYIELLASKMTDNKVNDINVQKIIENNEKLDRE